MDVCEGKMEVENGEVPVGVTIGCVLGLRNEKGTWVPDSKWDVPISGKEANLEIEHLRCIDSTDEEWAIQGCLYGRNKFVKANRDV